MARLVTPAQVAEVLEKKMDESWAARICAEESGAGMQPLVVPLRPGISGSAAVHRVGLESWTTWRSQWKGVDLADVPGVILEMATIHVDRMPYEVPTRLSVQTLSGAALALYRLTGTLSRELERRQRIARMFMEIGASLTPATLRRTCQLSDADASLMTQFVSWLQDNPDLSRWTARQIPVPGIHTKWVHRHLRLLSELTGRDLEREMRPRLAVVHLTYVDPEYLAGGSRRHDAWTTGDQHQLAYSPRVVLIVENRECRLWFPPAVGTVVVEGSGHAAAALLSRIEWILQAEHVIYWGDIDTAGFRILSALRGELASRGVLLDSILMDRVAHMRYHHLGVDHDRHGAKLKPSSTPLPHLIEDEAAAYAAVASSADVPVRRIEQERIPMDAALAALASLIPWVASDYGDPAVITGH